MRVWTLITTDPAWTGVAFFVAFYILQETVGDSWPQTIAFAIAGVLAMRTVHRRLPTDPGREAGG
ncbi:hypothetical protein [Lacipirellula limnantheis]|uniref:Uncharacterized protein n=1 Tax=Lacipirellula limnantheis TaxID=2528024 RepID=A0A517TVP9_9BACT|nr:hypothetical protein [Lacipirellula limnantheis]QDT72448.1 hypothetical protein I41_16260 [Lacipirellula limnantheis]